MNLDEDYCSFEVAKLLKEKGFDWMCNGYYNKDDENSEPYFGDGEGADNWNNQAPSVKDLWCSAPTHQMAMKWLREKGIFVEITAISLEIITFEFEIKVIDKEHGFAFYPKSGCNEKPTYEEAVEAALKYCLTELI